MAVAASEVVVGLGLIVAMGRRHVELDVDKLRTLRRVELTSRRLDLPAAAACLGARDHARRNGHLAPRRGLRLDADDDGRVRRRRRRVRARCWARARARAGARRRRGRGSAPARTTSASRCSSTSSRVVMMLIVTGVGSLIVAYSVGYMDGENEERRYFAYMSLFVFSMLLLVEGGNLLLLLAGWGMVGLSSYLLIGFYQDRPSAIAAAKKAFVMNAFGDATIALALFLLIEHTGQLDYAGVFAASPARRHGREPDRARPARRRAGEVRAAAAAHVASGRDGRPDAGQRPDPRGDDGHRRRLPDRALSPAVRERVRDPGSRRRARRGDAPDGRPDRARADGHQARDRVLDDVADRLHVRRRRARRVPERDVPPDDARLLQGAALPRRRHRHPRRSPASRTSASSRGSGS